MWRDIALANRENLLRALGGFMNELQTFRRLLKIGDAKAISNFFECARNRRKEWARNASSASPE